VEEKKRNKKEEPIKTEKPREDYRMRFEI